jgi:hypothetical protein
MVSHGKRENFANFFFFFFFVCVCGAPRRKSENSPLPWFHEKQPHANAGRLCGDGVEFFFFRRKKEKVNLHDGVVVDATMSASDEAGKQRKAVRFPTNPEQLARVERCVKIRNLEYNALTKNTARRRWNRAMRRQSQTRCHCHPVRRKTSEKKKKKQTALLH